MAEKEYISFADRFDGGGPGQSGEKFEGGGIISEIGNALGGPKIFGNAFVSGDDAPGGGTRIKHSEPVSFFTDAFDGGGFGYSGDYFSDGSYSILANILGIRPMGSENLVPQVQQEVPLPTVTRSGDTNDRLAEINQPSGFPGMAETSGPISNGIPTFSDFTEFPSVKFLTPSAQMQMYDALSGELQPQMNASSGLRI